MAKYEEDEYPTQLSYVWQYAVENDMLEALDILADGPYPSDIIDVLLLKDIPIDLQKKIFARMDQDTLKYYIKLLIIMEEILDAAELYNLSTDKNRLKNYLDKEFRREYASRSKKYNLFLERV